MNIPIALYAVLGSLLSECVPLYNRLRLNKPLPRRYKHLAYYIVRVLIALGAGLLPYLLDVQSPSEAFAIGAGAPIILHNLAQRYSKPPRDS